MYRSVETYFDWLPWKSMWYYSRNCVLHSESCSVFMGICKIGKLHKKWHWHIRIKWALVLTNFKHPFDLTISLITIIIPVLNTISAIVFESRKTLLWIALHLSFFRKTVVTKCCLQVLLLRWRICIFCFLFFKNGS